VLDNITLLCTEPEQPTATGIGFRKAVETKSAVVFFGVGAVCLEMRRLVF
jgi:hypothetical protein